MVNNFNKLTSDSVSFPLKDKIITNIKAVELLEWELWTTNKKNKKINDFVIKEWKLEINEEWIILDIKNWSYENNWKIVNLNGRVFTLNNAGKLTWSKWKIDIVSFTIKYSKMNIIFNKWKIKESVKPIRKFIYGVWVAITALILNNQLEKPTNSNEYIPENNSNKTVQTIKETKKWIEEVL